MTNPNNQSVELKESVWRFARYCNGLSPWKLNEEKPDPLAEGAINDFEAQLSQLLIKERLERGIYELERLEHIPQMHGDWQTVIEERIELLKSEVSDLQSQLPGGQCPICNEEN